MAPRQPVSLPTKPRRRQCRRRQIGVLNLAASSPDLARLQKSAHLTARAAEVLLSAADAPVAACYLRWPVVRDLTTALQGAPRAIRPLRERVKSLSAPDAPDGEGPSWPAAALG